MEDDSWKGILRKEVMGRICYGLMAVAMLVFLLSVDGDLCTQIAEAVETTGLTEEGIKKIGAISLGMTIEMFLVIMIVLLVQCCILNFKIAPSNRVLAKDIAELRKEMEELKNQIAEEDSDGKD